MRVDCLDESVLQSYLDGELSPEQAARAAQHIGACDACADALAAAGEELSLFARAFAPDPSLSVPTESLRLRLDAAVADMERERPAPRKGGGWNLSALAAWLAAPFNFEPRAAGAFAGLVAFVAIAAILGSLYFGGAGRRPSTVAENAPAQLPSQQQSPPAPTEETAATTTAAPTTATAAPPAVVQGRDDRFIQTAAHRNVQPRRRARAAAAEAAESAPKVDVEEAEPAAVADARQSVPGEERYLKTIASLSKVVEVSGPAVLRPPVLADYERNLAVVDRAIDETRRAALRNPKDTDTTSFLFSAYQNKIDLLTSVADQAQVATLGRD